jgi:hypothetical protein
VGLVTLPIYHAWKSVQSALGKGQEHQHRLTRLADGHEAVRLGTEAQKMHIVRRFEEEMCKTPERKKLYQKAIDKALDDGVELEPSSADVKENKPSSVKDVDVRQGSVEGNSPSSSQATENDDDDDVVFAREIELAMQLSLEANGQSKR